MKHAQEIFARADGEVEHASAGAPFVVEEGERIVQVGATEQYEIKFTESDGPSLPVVFKRHSCSELTYVHSVGKDMAMKKGRDQLVRSPRFEVLRCLHFVDVTRGHRTRPWVVSFWILGRFGPMACPRTRRRRKDAAHKPSPSPP